MANNLSLIFLAKHILAMRNDAYLTGQPEWNDIVREAENALAEPKDIKERLIEDLDNFNRAHRELTGTWESTPMEYDYDMRLSRKYPFDQSFAEIPVEEWVDTCKLLIRKDIEAEKVQES
jgi:hypothetical protein